MLIDTHCHIHDSAYPLDAEHVLQRAHEAGVAKMICVGTDQKSTKEAAEFAMGRSDVFYSIGVHPHETKDGWEEIAKYADGAVAVGEIGLDYFYTHSPKEVQIRGLEWQIDLALTHDLPIIFHVREAFEDFWPIFDNFHGIRGVVHSFTDTVQHRDEALKRGLFIGVNGISTFTKDKDQQEMFATIPLNRLLLETDAPFLTPTPFRGKVNEPAFVRHITEHQARIRDLPYEQIAAITTANAESLFAI
jgi:TatD DNase family protein